jgi:hypothetical protein
MRHNEDDGFRLQSSDHVALTVNAPLAPQGWEAGVGRVLDGRGGMGVQGGRLGPP